jgi:hypothetical protein
LCVRKPSCRSLRLNSSGTHNICAAKKHSPEFRRHDFVAMCIMEEEVIAHALRLCSLCQAKASVLSARRALPPGPLCHFCIVGDFR